MKIPVSPPSWSALLQRHAADFGRIIQAKIGPEVEGVYEHWDHLRHLKPPAGLDSEQWWLGIKLARQSISRELPLKDKNGRPLRIALSDSMLSRLHFIDREAAGSIQGLDRVDAPEARGRYLIRSLVEEAMTSSQLEGASTTRQVAKEMLVSGRLPRDRSEQMIWNNYKAMHQLARWRDKPLTPDIIFSIHRALMVDALDDASAAGRLRSADELIEVVDRDGGTILHVSPPSGELEQRMQALCDFANADSSNGFLHPVIRAIALHFQIGYDHPFVDGNGRTARALFYWSMLRSGYWLTEYLSISSVLKRAPSQYNRAYLLTETDESDLGYFISHQLNVICKAVDGLRDYLARKSREQRQVESLLRPDSALALRLNYRQRALLLHALRQPESIYRIAEHQHKHQVTYQTARTDLLGIASEGLFEQQRHGRLFVFVPVPDLAKRLGQ